ncbi:BRCT domain-containing protein [Pseudoalteromonas umbrosa]|uniref:BRCT domain-containing protein n=1 Tax=Pseudoalteromonas umbrosa TaxID=3048489 RepID=UPI0024C2421E|nr:BRCT domain-containing protein [Pseudoalteromonas sp. B95]MDK1290146.1 hypothetical protein [Pseudoalteromonas sp. B95]
MMNNALSPQASTLLADHSEVFDWLCEFVENATATVQNTTKNSLLNIISILDDFYYNTAEPLLADSHYDVLRELSVAQGIALDHHTGASARGDTVQLPYYSGSADKIKARTKGLERFVGKFLKHDAPTQFVLSDKLDGLSGTYWRDESGHHFASRGDGNEGTNWDHLLPYLALPPLTVGEVIKGEVILSQNDFNALSSVSNVHNIEKKTSARHMVAGMTAKLDSDENTGYLQFIAFAYPSLDALPLAQMQRLEQRGFKTAWYQCVNVSKSTQAQFMRSLEEIYTARRASSAFQIDGLIVTANVEHSLVTEGNPTHMAAFKMPLPEQMASTEVEYIEWNLSRYNVWVPRIKIQPVIIGGATYNWCHGENARAIERDGIGPGAKVVLLRSGDVIPDIFAVTERAQMQFPERAYEWDERGVELVLPAGESSQESDIKQISHVLTAMGMAGMKLGTVKRIYQEGYTSLKDFLALDIRALIDVQGIKTRSAESIYAQIHQVKTQGVPLYKLMAASAVFGRGFGEAKSKSALCSAPELTDLQPIAYNDTIVQRIADGEDFTVESAQRFMQRWPNFLAFIKEVADVKVLTDITASSGILDGKVIVFTEFRDADLQDIIELEGGKVGSSVTKKTTTVVTLNPTGSTTKLKKARDMGLPIMLPQDFALKYQLDWG